MDCIFCKIVDRQIPSYTVYEDDYVLAILDISQATKGHTLLLSKKHFQNLYDIDETYAAKIFECVPKIARAIKEAFRPIGLNVLINTEKPLQSVFHFHIHLIPRYEDDSVEMEFVNHMDSTSKEMYIDTLTKIKEQLK